MVFLFMSNFIKSDSSRSNVCFYKGNELVQENIESEGLMRFFYGNSCGRFFRFFLSKKWFSSLVGSYYNTSFSKRSINAFVKKHNIDMSLFEKSEQEYKNFNDFFIRKLKPGVRDIDFSSNSLISPCDSKLLVLGNLQQNTEFFIKDSYFNLGRFFKNDYLAKKFEGGTLLIFRLAPYDYHRFHFPFDCIPGSIVKIDGKYDSVNPIAFKSGYQPLTENKRHLIMLDTDKFGEVAMVPVGAICVGKIVETFKENEKYEKGDEAGYFSFGGSTVVLIFEKGRVSIDSKFIDHSKAGYETQVLFGEKIGKVF